jgi:hypothetical protein
MITNEQLRTTFLSPAMKYYFDRKLAPLPSAEVDARIEELLKYLNMALHSHGGIPFSTEIDDVWHFWILQTKEYMWLCHKLDGSKFIHHSSNDYEEYSDKNVRERPADMPRTIALLRSYVLNYGPFQADRIQYWPMAGELMRQLDWTVDQFNAWLCSRASAKRAAEGAPLHEESTAEA